MLRNSNQVGRWVALGDKLGIEGGYTWTALGKKSEGTIFLK